MTATNRLRLLTLNVLFRGDVRDRLRALGRVLEETPYDVVCLQELMYRPNLRLLRRYAPSYPHGAASGVGVLKGGLVILSRTPLTCRFEAYPMRRPPRPELLMRKGFQRATVWFDGTPLVVFNTHLSANLMDSWATENPYVVAQREELGRLAAAVASEPRDIPVVVMGDLNVPGQSRLFTDFVSSAGLSDVLAGDHRPTYRPTPRFAAPPDLDHVLLRPTRSWRPTVTARRVLVDPVELSDGRSMFLSDHYALEVDVFLPPGGGAPQDLAASAGMGGAEGGGSA